MKPKDARPECSDRLDTVSQLNEGTRSGVAVHGNRVIANVLLSELGREHLLDHDFDFTTATQGLEAKAVAILDSFSGVFPPNSYPGNVFKNQQRCSELIAAASATPAPTVPAATTP